MTGRELAALAGQEAIVVIRRPFVAWLGSIGRALLFDQLLFESDACDGEWFAVTDEEWQNRLLMSRREIRDARDYLTGLGILESGQRGMPRRTWYKLDADKAAKAFSTHLETGGASTLEWPNGRARLAKRAGKSAQLATHSIQGVEGVKTVPNGTAQAANDAAPRAPLAAHTNGSTQPEPLASPGLPPLAVNGASPAGAGEPYVLPAKPKRSARNGKASANGSAHAEPNPERAAESKLVFGELCTWLGLDWTRLPANTRGRLNKTAAALLDAGLGADAVQRARDAWRFDWRAKGGQVPDLSQVEGLVARAGAGLTASETPGHYPRYGVHDAPARVKMSEVF